MNTYCTNEGLERGSFLNRDARNWAISVLEWPGADRPVGIALPTSWAHDGAALWKLMIGGSALPGALWSVIGASLRRVELRAAAAAPPADHSQRFPEALRLHLPQNDLVFGIRA
jgi:hypothetical protein